MSEILDIQYDNLKKEIVKKCGNSLDVQKVKNNLSIIIDSRRSLSRIKKLNDVFHILEERDELDSNNVDSLHYLGRLLKNIDIINLVSGYKKLYIEEEGRVCSVCGEDLSFSLPLVNPETNSVESKQDSLQVAMSNVATNIGGKWPILARELDISECYIDEIRRKYPKNMYIQANSALKVWKDSFKDKATIDILKLALETRLCKMDGIGIHMLKPVISVD